MFTALSNLARHSHLSNIKCSANVLRKPMLIWQRTPEERALEFLFTPLKEYLLHRLDFIMSSHHRRTLFNEAITCFSFQGEHSQIFPLSSLTCFGEFEASCSPRKRDSQPKKKQVEKNWRSNSDSQHGGNEDQMMESDMAWGGSLPLLCFHLQSGPFQCKYTKKSQTRHSTHVWSARFIHLASRKHQTMLLM